MADIPYKQLLTASPHLFARDVFGLRMSPAHQIMMDHVESDGDRLLLCQRSLGKSRILQAYIAWFILNNPDERVILVSDSDTKAKSFLRVIKSVIESSDIIRQTYGDVRGAIWTDHELNMSHRTVIHPEVSLQAIGSGSGQATGKHCSLLVCDDLISFDTTRISSNRDKMREWFLTTLRPCLMSDGRVIACGTRYHGNDLYQTMIDDLDFNTLILPSIKSDGTAQCGWLQPVEDVIKNGKVVQKGLTTIKRSLGSVIYSLQYDNSTELLMSGNIIQAQWLQWYVSLPKLDNIIVACDPAISQKESADMTAIVVLGQDEDGMIHLIEYINEHLTFNATLNKLKSLVNIYKPEKVLLEEVSYQLALIQEAKRKITTCVISGVVPKGDKESRLRSVSPLFENERVYFKRSQNDVTDQLLTFPNVDRDDLCDAMSLGLSHYVIDGDPIVIF